MHVVADVEKVVLSKSCAFLDRDAFPELGAQ
jgi:hypothetical protein